MESYVVRYVGLCNGGVANNPLMGMTANNNYLMQVRLRLIPNLNETYSLTAT